MVAKNNVFNIRANGSSWIGMTGTRKGFVEFDSREHGIRASQEIRQGDHQDDR